MKKVVILCSLFLFIMVLNGCYRAPQSPPPGPPPGPTTPFTLEIWTAKNMYRVSEKIILTVRASQECYITLYDISTTGEVIQIFPNRYASDNLIQGGYAYPIPDESDMFDLVIAGPAGVERVRAIGTVQNVNLLDNRKIDTTEDFPRILVSPEQFDKSLNEKLNTMPSDQWAEASVTFQVIE